MRAIPNCQLEARHVREFLDSLSFSGCWSFVAAGSRSPAIIDSIALYWTTRVPAAAARQDRGWLRVRLVKFSGLVELHGTP